MKKIIPNNAVLLPDQAERVFQGVIYDVYQWQQPLYDGTKKTFEMLKRADTVGAVCIVNDRIIILEDEQPLKGVRLSHPTGRVEPSDLSLLSAAQREVREETGYTFTQWRLILVTQPFSKIEWFVHLYVAWDVMGKGDQILDGGEKIIAKELPFSEVKELSLQSQGYLGEVRHIFEQIESIEGLRKWPEFTGKEVDR